MTIDNRIFIIGASSSIAKTIVQCIESNTEIICITRKKTDYLCGIKIINVIEYSESEICKLLNNLEKAKKTTVIFCNGISDSQLYYKLSSKELREIINVNFTLPMLLTKVFLNLMLLDEIRFIYFSSSRAKLGDPGITMYSASKAALVAAVKSLSLEYGRSKKYFFIISLGLLDGGLINKISNEKIAELKKRSAIKNYVEFEEIQSTIRYILSNRSMTGSIIYCDNGYH